MQCRRCHHAGEAHSDMASSAPMGLGRCLIPECPCPEYEDAIRRVDEDLV